MKWRGLSFYFNFICCGQDYARGLYELYYGKQKEWKTKRMEKGGVEMSAVEVLKEMRSLFNESNSWEVTQERYNALYQALLALEKQEKQLYCAYEQGYEGLDFYGFFSSDKEALIGLKKEIKNSYTCDSEYRFFKLDFSKEGISTSLPVKEVLGVIQNDC